MNISFFEITKKEKKEISSKLKNIKINRLIFSKETLSKDNLNLAKNSEILCIFIYSNINKTILDKLPNLKMIITRSMGYDHIDLKECKKKGIVVCNVPEYGENTVAEHTFALILDLSRNIHKAYLKILGNNFSVSNLKGFDLKGKTLGVIGAGHIGSKVIRIARGFEMEVLVCDHHKNPKLQKELKFKYANLENLLRNSDIVTIHVTLNPTTKHLINKKTINFMKKGSILINTSRGEVVDTKALLLALEKNQLAGAGLDVIEGEKQIKEEKELLHESEVEHGEKLKSLMNSYKIIHNEKVIFTPHIAFYSVESLERILNTTIENIKCFINKKPKCVVKIK